MGYFSDLIDSDLVQRTLEVKGKTKVTYWRQLTAGQRVELLKGQVIRADADAVRVMDIVLSESAERNHRLVQMTLVDETGAPVYANMRQLQDEPAWLVEALVKLANEVSNDEGNG